MKAKHLTASEIRHFVENGMDGMGSRLLLHHLAVCPDCYAEAGYILDLYEHGVLPEGFSSIDLDLAKSRHEAPALLAKLSRYSFERQRGLVRDARQFRSWGLAELLCAESLREVSVNPARALELADLAVTLSSRLEAWEPTEPAWLNLLRAFSWAHLGNAWRVAGELPNAEHAFTMADHLWNEAASMGDVLGYEAKILALKASLRRTQGRFSLAIALLDRALLADSKGALRPEILVSKAFTLGESGDVDGSALVLREAIKTMHPEGTPRLFFILHHNLLDALSKAGHFEEARGLLPEVERLAESAGEPIDILRISWVKARVAAAEGAPAQAAELFEKTRRGFLKQGIVLDAALVALELSYLYLSEGKPDLVVEIARDLLSVFEVQDVPRETLSALAAFCRAAEAKAATAELARWAQEALEVAGRKRVVLPEAVH